MANSIVGICNSALIKIGAERIVSLSDQSKAAILCNEQFEKMRDHTLRSHPWKFARARASLAQLSTPPVFEFKYAFGLPGDCLKVLGVQDDYICYKIESNTLVTNHPIIYLKYTRLISDPTLFDVSFCEALSARLAAELAYPICNNASLSQEMWTLFDKILRDARSMSSQEGTPDSLTADDWIRVRF